MNEIESIQREANVDSPHNMLISAIKERRPLVIILGQDAWADGEDSILARAMERLSAPKESGSSWMDLLSASSLPDDFYQWVSERFKRRVHTSSLEAICGLPYSAIFTSGIDPTFVDLLTSTGREPEVILTAHEAPRAVRSLVRPPLYYLYSRAGEQDPRARPPSDLIAYNSRRTQHALPMLNTVLDTATAIGVILVEGYSPGRDWLRVDDLLGNIGNATPMQVLWFGGRPALERLEAALFDSAVESGRIIVVHERLATLIAELKSSGRLDDLPPPVPEDAGIVSFWGDQRLETAPEERLRVEAVASIVDDSWTSFLPPLGPDADYAMFRHFHGNFEGPRLLVEGVRRDFAIQRDFEAELENLVNGAIANHASVNSPIVVKGQSGTGKSVALARVVAVVREQRSAAVLYSVGRIPLPQDISDFCERAEDSGAKVTLVVCDANRDVDRYHDLLVGLRSRGRKVVVVGSQYQAEDGLIVTPDVSVEASAELSNRELVDLTNTLTHYFDIGQLDTSNTQNILAFFYRCLPPSRERIRAGLGDEARSTEQTLRRRGAQLSRVFPTTALHLAFIQAGIISDTQLTSEEEEANFADGTEDAAEQIIDLVMAAGSLNCPIPFNLLLRTVKARFDDFDFTTIADLFRGVDLFRWVNDPQGNDLLVSPRLTLEAQLLCQRRIGSPEKEAERILELVDAVRLGIEQAQETAFLLSILQQMSNDGPRGDRYKSSFVQIGRALTSLRLRTGITDPRLMLQESAFRRAAVRVNRVEDSQHLKLLEEARDAVQHALDLIDSGQVWAPLRTKQNLVVERATVYGFLANYFMTHNFTSTEVWQSYQAARRSIVRAVSVADSYHPLDIALWTPADLLASANLEEWQKAELAADIYSTLYQIEQDLLPPVQRDRYNRRRMRVGQAISDYSLTEDAYKELETTGSTAGYYLRARSYGPELEDQATEVSSPNDVKRAIHAAEFLSARMDKIESDPRCLALLLECMWIGEMQRRPLRGRRQPLPSSERTRRDFLAIIQNLNHASGEAARYVTRYLEGVLLWLSNNYEQARLVFRNLAMDTEFENAGRVVTRHVISDEYGAPHRFDGRVENLRQEGHWVVRVDGIGQTVVLLDRDFPNESIGYGRTIRGFSIAFNFIGPIAEPIR